MRLTPEQWQAAKRFAVLRGKVHHSAAAGNFIGACGEIAFNHWLAGQAALRPVSVAYWYASLKGTADFYVGPRAVGLDVKAHAARNSPTYPCFQATPEHLKITGVQAAIWVRLDSPNHGPVDWVVGCSEEVDATILGWSPIADVQASPQGIVRGNDVHLIANNIIRPLAGLAAFVA
jgi:hypothetical protein